MRSWLRLLYLTLHTLVLAVLLSGPRLALADSILDPGHRYTTPTLIKDTLAALPACLKYCLLGIEVRVRINLTKVQIWLVPRVEHHMAALHVMASDRFPKEPYIEWAATIGVIQKLLLDQLGQVVFLAMSGTPLAESSGGQTRYGRYGDHQSTNFKEVELIGHPVAVLPLLVDGTGNLKKDLSHAGPTGEGGSYGYGSGGSGESVISSGKLDIDTKNFITRWGDWAKSCIHNPNACGIGPLLPLAIISLYFEIKNFIQQIYAIANALIKFQKLAQDLRDIVEKVKLDLALGGGIRIDRLLCPNDVKYFYPYYLSGPDALFWRSGWPITDLTKSLTMLNPLSSDRVGVGLEIWGHLYPRHGFLNNEHPGHVAPVIAARGADLVADSSVSLRPKLTSVYARGDWQSLSPHPTAYCESNIATLPTPTDSQGGYAYNIWPKFSCPLSDVGSVVAFIPFRLCFKVGG